MTDPRRALPSVAALLESDGMQTLLARAPRPVVTEAVRTVVQRVRSGDLAAPAEPEHWTLLVEREVDAIEMPSLRPLFNATGVVLHTNLGRAPLARQALDAIVRTASGGANLEYDLEKGTRGSRYVHCVSLICELTGADDAIVVNNCAAALVLSLNSIADGKNVIISRGELIEIGGSFRVPEIMAKSGAHLREVGTTNRTNVDDYRGALDDSTGALVKVHRSNFEQRGFVAEASVRELSAVSKERGVPLLYDFGSGLLISLDEYGLRGEPLARDGISDGADLVLMSGDKMLGGPQAGIIAGRRDAVAACRRNPLCRAFRVDKLTLAALEATLALYRDPQNAVRHVPALAMLTASQVAVRARADSLGARLLAHGVHSTVVESEATVGGGAFPGARIDSAALALDGDAVSLEQRLRAGATPILGRIERDQLLLDLRSIPATEDESFATALERALVTHTPTSALH
ncbi:MAG: L-seryl-tRNA(Sec) selenium transferase [Gemmatimonadaceae bacterium]